MHIRPIILDQQWVTRTVARLLLIIFVVLALAIFTCGALSAAPQQSLQASSLPIRQGVFEPFDMRLELEPEAGGSSGFISADVPILMYHHVGAPYHDQYNIALSDFEAQMAYLAQNGYIAVSVDQIAAALRGQATLPPCPVAIAFDDGYADVYYTLTRQIAGSKAKLEAQLGVSVTTFSYPYGGYDGLTGDAWGIRHGLYFGCFGRL